jgi:glucose repression mediator protein
MAGQKYNKAYEAYQQAVYRDGRNPTFWCSIGVLYFQINQFRDALDAYSRAIRINPYISEVWFDLGSLYESCNNQISDAIDAYARASELDPSNPAITQRLQLLKTAQATGGQLPAAPGPQDVHPTAYASAVVPPHTLTGPPLLLQSSSHRPVFRTDSRGPSNEIALPPPSQVGTSRSSPGPFRGGPPPPVVLDEARHAPSLTPLAPMEVDRPHGRDHPGIPREAASRGPLGHQNLLLQHPIPQQQPRVEELRADIHPHHQESYFTRPIRPSSRSPSPHHMNRARSPPPPPPPFQNYPSRPPVGPAQPSPRPYPARHEASRSIDMEGIWDRRPGPLEHRGDGERRPRHGVDYPPQHVSQQPHPFYPPRSPGPGSHRPHSPPEPSPRSHPTRYWEHKAPAAAPASVPSRLTPPPPPPTQPEQAGRRYDPTREPRDYEAEQRPETRNYAGSPEGLRSSTHNPAHIVVASGNRGSESPHQSETKERRRRSAKDKEPEPLSVASQEGPAKRKKRAPSRRTKEEQNGSDTPKSYGTERGGPSNLPASFKPPGYPKGPGSPEVSSNGSGSSRSVQPSPTSATPHAPARVVDEDYDEGVTDALMSLASYRAPESAADPSHSPIGNRHNDPSPRPGVHRNSVSSTRSHVSPPMSSVTLKRPLSPGPEEQENKRSRMEGVKRRVSSPGVPRPSSRPSPIPFRTQPASHSPEARQPLDSYPPPSPPLPAVLPPHPRPVGAGHSHVSTSGPIALPPIATLSPPSTIHSPTDRDRDERMQVDGHRSTSPPSRSKGSEGTSSRSPPVKHTPSPSLDKKDSGS